MDKQIFAAIEVSDHEIRLIVGEFFNTRFNVIKTSKLPVYGLTYDRVVDKNVIVEGVKKLIESASKTIGSKIERVLLCIPAYRFRCIPQKIRKHIESIDGVCTAHDIQEVLKRAVQTKIDDNLALIQAVPIKYTVNGISSRRSPINEKCDDLIVEADLLCTYRRLAFDIVSCIEKAGVEVMDICVDMFAIAKEGAFLEQGVGRNIVLLKIERTSTTLGLINEGKLMACETFNHGLNGMIASLNDHYRLKTEVSAKLLVQNTRLDLQEYSDNPVYIYALDGQTRTLTEKDLVKCVQGDVKFWMDGIENLCKPILQQGPTTVIITGEGGELKGLDRLLQARLNVEVKNYCPDTLGARNSSLTACLGLFYAYKDQLPITGYQVNSVDMDTFMKAINYKVKDSSGDQEESITQKLRGILFDTKK